MKKPFVKLETDTLLRETFRLSDDERLSFYDEFALDLSLGDPEKAKSSLAKQLLNESINFIEKKRNAGKLGGLAKASTAKAKASTAKASSSKPKQTLPSSSSSTINNHIIEQVIEYLNKKTGKNFKASAEAARSHINARIEEGYTVKEFFLAIDNQCDEWLGTDYEKYLRPQTLFNREKFDGYVNNTKKSTGTDYGQY